MFAHLPLHGIVLEKFELYSTKSHYYLVGHDKAATAFKLLKLSRLEAELEAIEDPHIYSKAECTALLFARCTSQVDSLGVRDWRTSYSVDPTL